jgi:hypothetical protein
MKIQSPERACETGTEYPTCRVVESSEMGCVVIDFRTDVGVQVPTLFEVLTFFFHSRVVSPGAGRAARARAALRSSSSLKRLQLHV